MKLRSPWRVNPEHVRDALAFIKPVPLRQSSVVVLQQTSHIYRFRSLVSSIRQNPSLHPFLAGAILVTDVKNCVIRVPLDTYHCDDLLVACFRLVFNDDLVAGAQRPFAL